MSFCIQFKYLGNFKLAGKKLQPPFSRNQRFSLISVKQQSTNKDKNERNESSKAGIKGEVLQPKQLSYGEFRKHQSPIKKLIKVKDYADWIFMAFFFTGIYFWYKKNKVKKEMERKFEMEWLTIPYFKPKLFTCAGFYLPDFVARQLASFKKFKPRKDDVWIVSFPKSGTTWIQELVYLILNDSNFEKAKLESIETRSPFFDYPNPGLKEIEKLSSPRIIKTHLPAYFLPDNLENESKVIYITRNPKDVSVSYYHFTKMSTQADYTGAFSDFSKLFINGTVPYGPWWKHVDDYASRKNIFLINYEDLHEKPFEVVKKLCEFLGKNLSDSQIASIIKWCSFDSMKQNPTVNYEWYKDLGLFKKDGYFFRNGKIGDWLNHYSKSDSLALDAAIEKNLQFKYKFNYGISDQDLAKIYSTDVKKRQSN